MLNTLPVAPQARQPRALVRVTSSTTGNNVSASSSATTQLDAWVSWEVTSNTYYEADTFHVSFAASALPLGNGPDWFAQQVELFVEILAGFPSDPAHPAASELGSLIYGRVDDIEYDPVSGMVTLTGRDLTAAFIDAKITSEWSNQRSSDIATQLAQAHGLKPVVTATSTPVGTFYKHDQVRMQADRSEWDLLAWLAREEGFVCFVTGQELHFEPAPTETAEPYVLRWEPADDSRAHPLANVQALSFSRSLTVAKGISVTVRSPSLTKKTPVVQSYPSHPKVIQAGKASPFGGVQSYYFTIAAGKTPVDVQQYAIRKYNEILSHEMRLQARLPGDNLLGVKSLIRVEGTGTAFDQVYYPVAVTRMMSMDEGYTMTVEARNHNPDTAVSS